MRIVLWPYRKSDKWYRTVVSKLICFFTNSNYTHSAIWLRGNLYESTVMNGQNGALKTASLPPESRRCVLMKPIVPLSPDALDTLEMFLNRTVVQKRPYNFLKIVVLAIVYPTRKFWQKIGWVPFQNEVFGSVCSVYVDYALKYIGLDVLPGMNEEYTAPGDFLMSQQLEATND